MEEITSSLQNRLSKREQNIQDMAISLHERFGHCGDNRLIRLINSGKILNCPITSKQFMQTRKRIGPCLHCSGGKLTQDHTNAITIDQHYPTSENEDYIFSHIFYVKGSSVKTPYLISVTAKSKHIHISALKSKTGTNITNSLSTLIKKYKSFGLASKRVSNYLLTTEQQLQLIGAELIQNSPEMHSRQAERAIRTIKSLARSIYISFSYTLPQALYPYLFQFATERYNILPSSDGIR